MFLSLIIWITLAAIITTFFLHKFTSRNKNLPPGPKGVPILGHLHMVGKNPHQDLQKIAQKYGPIMYMKFGLVPNIIVSSPQRAELFLKTHDLHFASRPPLLATKYMTWDQRNLTFASYGPYWRNVRKLCTLELLSSLKINSFQSMRKEELSLVIKSLTEAAKQCVRVDLSAKVASLTANMSCRMVFGKKYEDRDIDERGFKPVIEQMAQLFAAPNLGDFFPFLGILDLQGLNRKMKAIAKVFDDFFEKIIDEHVKTGNRPGHTKDIVDTMLSIMASGGTEFQFDRGHVKAIMLDMLGASIDTSGSTVEWILSELLRNPRIMQKLQKELEDVVGLDRMVEESDLDNLEYLDLVIKETFRLHPVAPLLLPHYSMEDCTVDGYDIPKESRVMINVYAIGRDPNVWSNPNKFLPERFMGSDVDVRGQHFQLLPFGSGRRGCPGMQLGIIQVRLIVAQLVHCFDWDLPDNMMPDDLDMIEAFGIVVNRKNHLIAIPRLRLQN